MKPARIEQAMNSIAKHGDDAAREVVRLARLGQLYEEQQRIEREAEAILERKRLKA